jgi:hypothetical protein
MIVTDHFAFVHLHKAGGSFVTEFLLRCVPSARRIGYHYPRAILPAEYADRPILGSVRNPWDFYVSYYHFQAGLLAAAKERNAARSDAETAAFIAAGNDPLNGIDVVYLVASDDGRLGFAETTRNLLSIGTDEALLDRMLADMPTRLNMRGRDTPVQVGDGFRGMNVRAEDLASTRGTGEGLFSFLYRHMYGDGSGIDFLKMETLRADLLGWMRGRDIPVTNEMETFVRGGERVNTSRHDRSATYYDADLSSLVGERDASLVTRFGYRSVSN